VEKLITRSRTYDLAGRVTAVVTPDNATVSTTYNGNQVTVTDQAGKKRRSESDAHGRLTKVTEAPGVFDYVTNYSYDALGNLRLVKQGSQTRTFAYDSLSRLMSATNPESGTVTYAYDPNGNPIEKTDARGVRATMTYDAFNRARSKVFVGTTPEGIAAANATPPVTYFYDDYSVLPSGAPRWPGTPSKGRLIGVIYGTGSEGTYYKYDAGGRIVINHQRQGIKDYATTYNYNLAGGVTFEQRGSYFRNFWTYDNAGRISGMDASFTPFTSGSVHLAKDIVYTPSGGLQSETYGNSLIHSMDYNDRLQPTEMRLGRPENPESVFTIYSIYGTANNVNGQDAEINLTQNNGNIARIKYSVSGTIQYTQTFQYDSVNRLRYAVEHNNGAYNDGARAWFQTFDYDPYGNRGLDVANTSDNADAANTALQFADFSKANNRITRAGFRYDASGNLIAEPGKEYTYDGEGRIVAAAVAGVPTSQYLYDGIGRRVKKVVGGVATRFEYGAGGELIAERNDSNSVVTKGYCYKGGELLATTKNGVDYEYATADHLGSPRAWTGNDGNPVAGGRHDYMPFGEELGAGVGIRTTELGYGGDSTRQKFTGKERDDETGLDYFGARYLASAQGRFISVDPYNIILETEATAEINPEKAQAQLFRYLSMPQQWNRYSYVVNNPLKYIDPTGELLELTGTEEERKKAFEHIKNMVGPEGASLLYVMECGGKYYVNYDGKQGAGDKLAGTSLLGVFIANIIDDPNKTLEYRLAETFETKDGRKTTAYYGGAAKVGAEESLTGNTQIFVHPTRAASIANSRIGPGTLRGGLISSDGRGLMQYDDNIDAHEFGHGYANMIEGISLRDGQTGSNPRALQLDNYVRERRGLNTRRRH
jgi:RHS repeat-associated protein